MYKQPTVQAQRITNNKHSHNKNWLTIVLSVPFQYTASDFPCGVIKLSSLHKNQSQWDHANISVVQILLVNGWHDVMIRHVSSHTTVFILK